MQDFMTDQELIAKQAAIIQAQEIEIKELNKKKNKLQDWKDEKCYEEASINTSSRNYEQMERREITRLMEELYLAKEQVSRRDTHIEFLRCSFKKRPKFIMIINRRKKHVK